MRVVAELDAGAMFSKVTRPIGIDETSVDVEQALAEIGATALVDAVEQLAHGGAIETPQDDALATYAPKLEKSEGPIVWSLSAREVHNRVRGLQPWPMASTSIEGHRAFGSSDCAHPPNHQGSARHRCRRERRSVDHCRG
jgi:methionyl-tRNA formyltransferase